MSDNDNEGKKKRILGSMNVDYDKFDEKDSEGKYLFSPPNVLSLRRKIWYLDGWTAEEISAVEEQLTIYKELPIVCKGDSCPFADICPLVSNGLVKRWLGVGCPIEVVDAFRHFAGYINDLSITPTDYVDIQMVNDLVRLQILMGRCDKLIRRESPVETMVVGTDSKTGLKHDTRQPNQLLEAQRRLRQDIHKIYQLLVASRQAKVDAEAKQQRKADVSNQMADLLEYAKKLEDTNNPTEQRMGRLEL
jgi:hypothetical protein